MARIKLLVILFLLISFKGISQDSSINMDNSKRIDTVTFESVDSQATFPGGNEAWRKYLLKNLKINIPVKKKAPPGAYKVVVRFRVSVDGTISDIQSETKHGYGMEEEVIRIIEKSPKWIPATLNGNNVNAFREQPITFLISEN